MVFFAVLLIFTSRTSKFRHSLTKKRQLLGDEPQTPPGLCPWTPLGDLRPPDPPGLPPFAHFKYATDTVHCITLGAPCQAV